MYANARRPAWPTGPWRGGFVADRLPPAESYAETRTRPGEKSAPQKIEAEFADLERRLTCQLVNLEADDVTAALRRRVRQRVAELEDAIAERRERLVALARKSATEASTSADVAPLLDRLPILADRLAEAPQGELRALFDALQLDVVYQPADGAVDVAPHPCDTLIFLTKRFVVAAATALWFDRPAAHPRGWCRGHRHRSLFHAGHVLRLVTLPTLPCSSIETLTRGSRSGRWR